jgi:hypothetical protein
MRDMERVKLIKIHCNHVFNITIKPPVQLIHANKKKNRKYIGNEGPQKPLAFSGKF